MTQKLNQAEIMDARMRIEELRDHTPTEKSKGVGILLAFLFGPFGLCYSSLAYAAIGLIALLVLASALGPFAFLATWPVFMVLGARGVDEYNRQRRFERDASKVQRAILNRERRAALDAYEALWEKEQSS